MPRCALAIGSVGPPQARISELHAELGDARADAARAAAADAANERVWLRCAFIGTASRTPRRPSVQRSCGLESGAQDSRAHAYLFAPVFCSRIPLG